MEFNMPKTHELFRQMIREFAEKEVKPLAAEVDEEERFPIETVKKMAEIGLMGIPIPKEYGGWGNAKADSSSQNNDALIIPSAIGGKTVSTIADFEGAAISD